MRASITIHIGRGEPPSVYWQDFIPADDAWMEGIFLPDRYGVGGGEHRQYTPQATRQALLGAGLPLVYADHLLASPFAFTVSAEVAGRAQDDWLAAWVRYRDCTSSAPSGDPRLGLRLATVGLPGVGRRSAGVEFRYGVQVMPFLLHFAPAYASPGGVALAEEAPEGSVNPEGGGVPEGGSLGGGWSGGSGGGSSVWGVPDSSAPQVSLLPALPRGLAPVCLELFAVAQQFNGTLHGPEGGNFRWTFDARQQTYGAYFEAYGRRMVFFNSGNLVDYGTAHVVVDKIATLRVIWAFCPIPASITHRVDTKQKMNYEVDSQGVVVGFNPSLELFHFESGEYRDYDMLPGGLASGNLRNMELLTRDDWTAMSGDDWGIIRHAGADQSYALRIPSPAAVGLPPGTVRARCLLLGDYYATGICQVLSRALGGADGDRRMSKDDVFLQFGPSWSSYTPGRTEGLMPPLEFELPTVLADGIEFDAVFDLKNLALLRFVVKVTNLHDFAVGVVVAAGYWQAWAHIPARSTKYLGGSALLASSRFNLPLPENIGDPFSVPFKLYLTKPMNPEPADLPEKEVAVFGDPVKVYSPDGTYDKFALNYGAAPLKSLDPVTSLEPYLSKINAESFGSSFVMLSWYESDHYRFYSFFPIQYMYTVFASFFQLWSTVSPRYLACRGEKWVMDQIYWGPSPEFTDSVRRDVWNLSGSSGLPGTAWGRWVPCEVVISIPASTVCNVIAQFGATESVVIDGNDVRWFRDVPGVDTEYSLWADRFYGQSGELVTESMIREAFQTEINSTFTGNFIILASRGSSDIRNLTVHPSVRFGVLLNSGSAVEPTFGNVVSVDEASALVEVSGLDDLDSLSKKFLCVVRPEYR